jgi:hypothetical protein
MQIFRDSTRKRRSLDIKIQALTVKETTSKAHMQVHTSRKSREKQLGRKPGPNRAETDLDRPAGPAHSGPGSTPPFDLVASRAIYSPLAESHAKIDSSSTTTRLRTRSRLDCEGSTRGLHLLRGFYTMISATMSNIMG